MFLSIFVLFNSSLVNAKTGMTTEFFAPFSLFFFLQKINKNRMSGIFKNFGHSLLGKWD